MSAWRWRYERTDGSEVVDVAMTPGHSEGGNEALASRVSFIFYKT